MKVSFCTCDDPECPFNPVNHERGCTPCIAKNLREHEIPTCLFYAISPNRIEEDKDEWSWQAFARHVEKCLGSDSPRIPAGENAPEGLNKCCGCKKELTAESAGEPEDEAPVE